jgi:tetratricopeptide (TPR) repeat protein
VEELVRRAARENLTYLIWRCVLADMLLALGSTAEARTELDALASDSFGAIPFDEEWAVSVCFLAEAAARTGDRDRAETLYGLLLRHAGKVALSYPEISLGPVSRFLGLLASTTCRYDDAARHFEAALATTERIGARPWLAHTQDDYAHMLLARSEPGDAGKASGLLDGARAAYRELGISPPPSSLATALADSGRV